MKSNTDCLLKAKSATPTPTDEHPEADIRHIMRGVVRRGLQPLPSKSSIPLRVDPKMFEWFKAQGPATKRVSTLPPAGVSGCIGQPPSNPESQRQARATHWLCI
ncbi:MAG: hypothetical protein IPG91_24080 [Ideonella sp.]|nr:hypothetical protein [Ideonella sp.]